jgi:hypothetical protein
VELARTAHQNKKVSRTSLFEAPFFVCLFDDGNVRESMLAVGDSPGQRTRKRRRAMQARRRSR